MVRPRTVQYLSITQLRDTGYRRGGRLEYDAPVPLTVTTIPLLRFVIVHSSSCMLTKYDFCKNMNTYILEERKINSIRSSEQVVLESFNMTGHPHNC